MGNPVAPLPGSPTVGQIALAEQRHALVHDVVDRLVLQGVAAHTGNDLADWLTGALRAADAVQESSHGDEVQVAIAVAAEAVRRISDLGVRNGRKQAGGGTDA